VKSYLAPKKVRAFCEVMGFSNLSERIDDLKAQCGLPMRLRDAGIGEEQFRAILDRLVDLAFSDPSLIANPRRPLLSEIRQLFEECY